MELVVLQSPSQQDTLNILDRYCGLSFDYQSIKILTTPILHLMVPNNVVDRFVLKNMLDVLCYLSSLLVTLTSLHSVLSFFLSLGRATEVPKLTHYGMVLFQTRA